MKHTKEQLQGMSDLEVNTVLVNLLGFDDTMRYAESHLILNYNSTLPGQELKNVNYCNNPSDIMPLAFEYEISVVKDHDSDQYYACCAFDDRNYDFAYRNHECFDLNPLRAIACCLILLLQEQQK